MSPSCDQVPFADPDFSKSFCCHVKTQLPILEHAPHQSQISTPDLRILDVYISTASCAMSMPVIYQTL